MPNLPIIFSTAPFLIFVILLLRGKTTLLKASLATLSLFILLSVFYWKIFPVLLLISFGKGFMIAFDIFIIIIGAIFFLTLLEELGVIDSISSHLERFSSDYRVQIILLAWLFEAFIEGTAGFGTPVAIVAPLLIGLGLSPVRALIVSLMGNSTAVVFGAVGTPIRVGLAGLDTAGVPLLSALINCAGFIVPVFMLWVITSDRIERKKEFLDGLPFALWAGAAFVVPSVLALWWGQEFPSIAGSLIGILAIYLTTKLGWFIPAQSITLRKETSAAATIPARQAFMPYAILVLLLIAGKIFLSRWSIPIPFDLKHSFNLFNPGFPFIIAALAVAAMWRRSKPDMTAIAAKAFKGAVSPFLVIVSMSMVVQIMINSGQNHSGLPAAIDFVAKVFEGSMLPFFAPFIGAFGSFVTGSATVSNIMFGSFFATAAPAQGLQAALILSLAVVGAAAGNMIALSDMLAGQAVIGLKNKEREVVKGVIVPCLSVLVIVGAIGMLLA